MIADSLPPWLDTEEYDFRHRWFDTDAGRLHYIDEGEGPALIMVPGNPDWSYSWRHLVRRFRNRFRCIVPDHLGFGLSDKPSDWSYLPRDHARNFASLLDHLGIGGSNSLRSRIGIAGGISSGSGSGSGPRGRIGAAGRGGAVHLIVNDWGGPIALSWAVSNPGSVASLVIENSWCWDVRSDWYYQAYSRLVGGPVGRRLNRHTNFFAGLLLRMVFGDTGALTREEHAHFKKQFASPAERHGVARFPREVAGSGEWLSQIWAKTEPLTDKPALFVWGEKDPAFREKELRTWLARFPRAELLRLPDAGHMPHLERPEVVGEALEGHLASIH